MDEFTLKVIRGCRKFRDTSRDYDLRVLDGNPLKIQCYKTDSGAEVFMGEALVVEQSFSSKRVVLNDGYDTSFRYFMQDYLGLR